MSYGLAAPLFATVRKGQHNSGIKNLKPFKKGESGYDFHLKEFTCVVCGVKYTSKASYSKYCSNKCKEKNRKLAIYRCQLCGKEFKRRTGRKYEYCSKRCAEIANLAKARQKRKIVLKGKEIQCLQCGKSFYVQPHRFETAKFCSPRCRGLSSHKQFKGICLICGKEFEYIASREGKAKYCSKTCYYKAMAKKGTVEYTCLECGKKIISSPSHPRKYCSKECLGKAQRKTFETYAQTPGVRRALQRRGLLKKCMECGYDAHPEILGVHHKDGNHSNNSISNLMVLCPNCHSLKHGYHIPH